MKKTSVIITLISILISCGFGSEKFFTEIKEIEPVVNSVAKSNLTHITFEHIVNNNSRELVLTIHNYNQNDLLPGKILFEAFNNLVNKKIYHDKYEVVAGSSKILRLSKDELELINTKYNYFLKNIELLTESKYEAYYEILFDEMKEYPIEELTKNFDNIIQNGYQNFDGFKIENYNGSDFVIFKASSSDKNNIMMSFKLEDDKNIIHGFQIE